MGRFEEFKEELKKEVGSKKNFNRAYFNAVATELLNDADYTLEELVTEKGELVEKKSQPIQGLRKAIIAPIAKEAGCDAAETDKIVAEHEFKNLPMYEYIDATLQEYMSLGKKFQFSRKENFQGSIELCHQEAQIKDVKAPGSTEVKKQHQEAYTKLKAKSSCPDNLRKTL